MDTDGARGYSATFHFPFSFWLFLSLACMLFAGFFLFYLFNQFGHIMMDLNGSTPSGFRTGPAFASGGEESQSGEQAKTNRSMDLRISSHYALGLFGSKQQ